VTAVWQWAERTEPRSGDGPDLPAMTGKLARNLRESRLGVLFAVLTRD
jgi:hypothetical protein